MRENIKRMILLLSIFLAILSGFFMIIFANDLFLFSVFVILLVICLIIVAILVEPERMRGFKKR